MSLPLLRLLGHSLSNHSLAQQDRQAVWTICCVAFYGSLRLGEILCQRERGFNKVDAFLWSDVSWIDHDHVILHLRNTKSAKHETVDIFSIPSDSTCPVLALRRFQLGSQWQPSSPVFTWLSGAQITPRDMNKLLPDLLKPLLGSSASQISGHSFRAGIPSLLAKFPEESTSDEIMGWGRWKSSAYLSYTKLKSDQRKKVFEKILSLLHRRASGSGC